MMLCAAFRNSYPFYAGLALAAVSLFLRGYRGVFVGFIALIGLFYLVIIVVCGAMGVPKFQ
jgi:hypothetical protein